MTEKKNIFLYRRMRQFLARREDLKIGVLVDAKMKCTNCRNSVSKKEMPILYFETEDGQKDFVYGRRCKICGTLLFSQKECDRWWTFNGKVIKCVTISDDEWIDVFSRFLSENNTAIVYKDAALYEEYVLSRDWYRRMLPEGYFFDVVNYFRRGQACRRCGKVKLNNPPTLSFQAILQNDKEIGLYSKTCPKCGCHAFTFEQYQYLMTMESTVLKLSPKKSVAKVGYESEGYHATSSTKPTPESDRLINDKGQRSGNSYIERYKAIRDKRLKNAKECRDAQEEKDTFTRPITPPHRPVQSPPVHQEDIGLKDFVVRSGSLRCYHKNHQVENIVASVPVLNPLTGRKQHHEVSAGFCRRCKKYFITEGTFESLKTKGVLLCKVVDKKTYHQMESGNYDIRNESELMMYGYSVSKQKGLSPITRHQILAMLIDEGIMPKTRILSYLDYFIRMNRKRASMRDAIGKWEADMRYVSAYKNKAFRSVGVSSIRRG